jgi:Tfp pilus assembly protein PilZ
MQGLSKQWVELSHDFRRQYERKNYSADITFVADNQMFLGGLQNISVGGAFIETRDVNQLCEGELVTLSIPYTDGNKHVKRKGRVLWKNDIGFAVGFN